MAHIGRLGPVAWCRDLSHPPWEAFNYLPKWLLANGLRYEDTANGIVMDVVKLSNECEYDYDDGSVTYKWEHTHSGFLVELVVKSIVDPDNYPWFRVECTLLVDSVVTHEFMPDPSTWSANGTPYFNYGEWYDESEGTSWGVIMYTQYGSWEFVPV